MEYTFRIFENNKLIGKIKAESAFEALSNWSSFAGPGNYTTKI